jgi:hypothetical protein
MAELNGREVPDYGSTGSARCVFAIKRDVRAPAQQNKATYPERVHVWEDEQCW